MTGIYEISHASTTMELEEILENAAYERHCELDSSMTYKEQASFLREEAQKDQGNGAREMLELADILDAAESKWFELEG